MYIGLTHSLFLGLSVTTLSPFTTLGGSFPIHLLTTPFCSLLFKNISTSSEPVAFCNILLTISILCLRLGARIWEDPAVF
ncbi:hypothetical protein WJX77_004067 [Trebouxia sp. C0004]